MSKTYMHWADSRNADIFLLDSSTAEASLTHVFQLRDVTTGEILKRDVTMTMKEANRRNEENKLMFSDLKYEWQLIRKTVM